MVNCDSCCVLYELLSVAVALSCEGQGPFLEEYQQHHKQDGYHYYFLYEERADERHISEEIRNTAPLLKTANKSTFEAECNGK